MSAEKLDATNVPDFAVKELNALESFLLQESMSWIQELTRRNPALTNAPVADVVKALQDSEIFRDGKKSLLEAKSVEGKDTKSLVISQNKILEEIERRPYTEKQKQNLSQCLQKSTIDEVKTSVENELETGSYSDVQKKSILGKIEEFADLPRLKAAITKTINKKIIPFSEAEKTATETYSKAFAQQLKAGLENPQRLQELVTNASKALIAMYSMTMLGTGEEFLKQKRAKAVELGKKLDIPSGVNPMNFVAIGKWTGPYMASKLQGAAKDFEDFKADDMNKSLSDYSTAMTKLYTTLEQKSGKKITESTKTKIEEPLLPLIAQHIGSGGNIDGFVEQLFKKRTKFAFKLFDPTSVEKAIRHTMRGEYSISTESLKNIAINHQHNLNPNKTIVDDICKAIEIKVRKARRSMSDSNRLEVINNISRIVGQAREAGMRATEINNIIVDAYERTDKSKNHSNCFLSLSEWREIKKPLLDEIAKKVGSVTKAAPDVSSINTNNPSFNEQLEAVVKGMSSRLPTNHVASDAIPVKPSRYLKHAWGPSQPAVTQKQVQEGLESLRPSTPPKL